MEVISMLEKVLNIRAFYHKLISGNLANVETPNYKEKDINFQEEFVKRINGSGGDYDIKEKQEDEGIMSIDGNSVNIEDQMVKLTENSMLYNSLVQIISKKFARMKYAISDGRG